MHVCHMLPHERPLISAEARLCIIAAAIHIWQRRRAAAACCLDHSRRFAGQGHAQEGKDALQRPGTSTGAPAGGPRPQQQGQTSRAHPVVVRTLLCSVSLLPLSWPARSWCTDRKAHCCNGSQHLQLSLQHKSILQLLNGSSSCISACTAAQCVPEARPYAPVLQCCSCRRPLPCCHAGHSLKSSRRPGRTHAGHVGAG